MSIRTRAVAAPELPEVFARWFAGRGWTPRAHQLELLAKAQADRSALLIAPTGGGKTLAGFLPTLVELSAPSRSAASAGHAQQRKLMSSGRGLRRAGGLHTLYISPLKALAVDIARNLETPVDEMSLPIRIETRTGDTPTSKRQRQRRDPPDILLTTPEQLALLLASADAPYLFGSLRRVVLDELHSLVLSKRGDLLALGLARLFRIAPDMTTIGLSATVAEPAELCRYLAAQPAAGRGRGGSDHRAWRCRAQSSPCSTAAADLPWAGHSARHAFQQIYDLIKRHKTTLVFVNTRMQAEMIFQALWRINEDGLAIALHHGSLDVAQRRKVEGAMAAGRLRAVVCTSSLDLGVDWGDIDLVVNVGAPKGSSRLLQRIGRANHRMDEASRGVLVPANRFEVLECTAAIEAVAENAQDTPPLRTGALDVLAQHVLGCACGAPFLRRRTLCRGAPGGALRASCAQRFRRRGRFRRDRRLCAQESTSVSPRSSKPRTVIWRIAHPRIAQRYRMNVGTIVEADMLKVRLVRARESRHGYSGPIARGGKLLGQVEEYFVETHDTGRHLRVLGRDPALRGAGRGRSLRLARDRRRPEDSVL